MLLNVMDDIRRDQTVMPLVLAETTLCLDQLNHYLGQLFSRSLLLL